MSQQHDKITKARLKLLRKKYNLSYFGVLTYNFDLMVVDGPQYAEGWVPYNKDKTIYINRTYIEYTDYTYNNCAWLILHELMHVLHYHTSRVANRNKFKWNIAADHCIERDLKEITKSTDIMPYKSQYNIIKKLHQEQPKCTVEEAYIWIEDNPDKIKYDTESSDGMSIEVSDDYNTWTVVIEDIDNIDKEKVNEFIVNATSMYANMKEKGNIPGAITEILDQFIKVKVPWDEILNKKLNKSVIKKPRPNYWNTPRKSLLPIVYLPGPRMKDHESKISEIVFMIDTSASMSKEDLMKACFILSDSMRFIKKMYVLTHDTKLTDAKDFKNSRDFASYINTIGLKGRGGTSHTDVFNWVDNYWNESKTNKNNLSLVIAITDGHSNLTSIYKSYSWLNNGISMVILMNQNSSLNFEYDNIEIIPVG